MKSLLHAIIFDVDGTLADTEETHRQAFNLAFKEFGLDWDWTPTLYEELLSISGGRERITYFGSDLKAEFGSVEEFQQHVRQIHDVKTKLYADLLDSGNVKLRPGVERLLHEARRANLTLAIATSSKYSNLKTLLDRNLSEEWPSWFSSIKTCDTVDAKKPSPAVYQAVLEEISIAPEHCIAIEDTENGLAAASAAGLATIVTTHFFTRHHHFPTASLVIDHLGDMDYPFKVLSGDPGEKTHVDIELINDLLAAREAGKRQEQTAPATAETA